MSTNKTVLINEVLKNLENVTEKDAEVLTNGLIRLPFEVLNTLHRLMTAGTSTNLPENVSV